MEPDKTNTQKLTTLPYRTTLYLITGNSGIFEDKSTWSVCAYSELKHAQKASTFLQKLADRLEQHDEVFSEEFKRDLEELKLHDPKAYYNERIFYSVEPIIFVV